MSPVGGEEPTVAEIWRLLKRQDEQFAQINSRLDKMLTTEGLAAYMGVHAAELRHLREDHDEFEKKVEQERVKADVKIEGRFEKIESKMTTTVRWAIGAIIAGAGVIIAAVGQFIGAVGGA